MANKKKPRYKPVDVELCVPLTSNGFLIPTEDITSVMWKRVEQCLNGRCALMTQAHLEHCHLSTDQTIIFDKAFINRNYIVERTPTRVLAYDDKTSVVLHAGLNAWLLLNEKLPRTIIGLYDNELNYPRNTVGKSGGEFKLPVYEAYKRTKIIRDSQDRIIKVIWRLK